ncbi:MAG: CRISPR-associated endonuclease Cas2 [Bacteroidota bacterium]|nr:CRISPR-associated endonuclease Cas2 [Bacteroidota bacterium]
MANPKRKNHIIALTLTRQIDKCQYYIIMIYMIMYDISNDALRKKTADRLLAYGYERIQFSIFIGTQNPKQIKGMWRQLKDYAKVNCPGDKMLIIG